MVCGTIEKMPTEVKQNEKVSAQNGQSRIASATVGPAPDAACARTRPGAPAAMRRHGSTSTIGTNTTLAIENTR